MAAKHLEVSRNQGAKEGFKMWKMNLKRSGIPAVQDRYQELLAQGDVEAQFRYYCAQYGAQFGLTTGTKPRSKAKPAAPAPAPSNDLFTQFQAFLATQAGTADEIEEEDEEDDEDAILDALPEPTVATAARITSRSSGAPADDPYAPRVPDAHATNGRLWKLNELGLLRIAKTPGDAITNGDAHKILKSLL